MGQNDTDFKKIKKLIDIMEDNDLVEVEIKHGNDKILLKRSQPQQRFVSAMPACSETVASPAAEAKTSKAKEGDGLIEIKSPIVGTFYITPSPDSESYVEVDSVVEPQTVVCIIEAMKVMNEIKAETRGRVAQILVTNGQAVEYGQVLFKVKPE